jgi:hypothetical protein
LRDLLPILCAYKQLIGLEGALLKREMVESSRGCSLAGAVERLALETDESYADIPFPETE